jgi:hypothetical protein
LSSRAKGSLANIPKNPIPVSSTGPGTAPSVFPRVLSDVFGWHFKIIDGYPGSQEALQAIETGEADGHLSGGSSAAFRARILPWIEAKQASIILQMGFRKDDAFPDAPLALDLAKNEADHQLLELVLTPQLMGRPFLAPPNVPTERIEALRSAFDETMTDPAFLAEAEKLHLEVQPVDGAQIQRVLRKVYGSPKILIDRARSLMK